MPRSSDWFSRYLLPGFAFKAVVIGGGYATGRELATFFLPSGPRGGLYGMLLAMALWSAACAITFVLAMQWNSRDYKSFFSHLLGPFWALFEIAYGLGLIVTLAVFAAAAGAIAQALFALPLLAGAVALVLSIALFSVLGQTAVEQLFKYVSIFLYGIYGVFLVLSLAHFGPQIGAALATTTPTKGWTVGGLTYAGYNVVSAVVVLPVIRHLRTRKDAMIAGILAGPLAMIPAILFFVSMVGFYPQIQGASLPSDVLLTKLDLPIFRLLFQFMIFAALVESGVGGVHAINQRIAKAHERRRGTPLSTQARLLSTSVILVGSVFIAERIGLVSLIANGYRFLAYMFLALYVAPLSTIGVWRIARWRPAERAGDGLVSADGLR